jgi:hypothetical protein
MQQDQLAVARGLNIELHHVRVEGNAVLDGGHGIFWCMTTCAAMADP